MSSVSTTNISGTDNDFDRPSGTGSFFIATQALRTWLLSCCPSGTKYIYPTRPLLKLTPMGGHRTEATSSLRARKEIRGRVSEDSSLCLRGPRHGGKDWSLRLRFGRRRAL